MDDVTRSPAPPLPRYQLLKDHIVEQVTLGKLVPGDRVPSEGDLVADFSVSRMTANRALRELAAEGVITRLQGVGSFVTQPKAESSMLAIRNIAEEIRERGQHHQARVIRLAEERDSRSNRMLGLPPGSTHFRSILVHLADEVPVQLEDRRVNPQFAPNYLQQDFTRTTPNQHLMSLATLQFAEHVFEAEMPTAREARLLELNKTEPCLVLRRRTWSLGIVASFALIKAPSSRYRYKGTFGTTEPRGLRLPSL